MPPIALITDFGTGDRYVGEMKGAIATVASEVPIIDISHHIAPGDLQTAAFILDSCYRTFPHGTVFCVVVDPGVGSSRNGIVASAGHYLFVGPDNGVLTWALLHEAPAEVRTIDNSDFLREGEISPTFHGRDVFGPVAAHLAKGTSIIDIGAETTSFIALPFPQPVVTPAAITTEIVAIDRFGNVVTTVDNEHLELLAGDTVVMLCKGSRFTLAIGAFFASVPKGDALCYIGSAGYLEIGVNGGNASQRFGLSVGDRIEFLR